MRGAAARALSRVSGKRCACTSHGTGSRLAPQLHDLSSSHPIAGPSMPRRSISTSPANRRPAVSELAPHAAAYFPPQAVERSKVAYSPDKMFKSSEMMGFFADTSAEGQSRSDGVVESDVSPELVPGRIVECRRSGQTTLGLILASVYSDDRPRLLILRASGEIWPVSTTDVQFIMPSSIIPRSLAEKCWSSELLAQLSKGGEVTGDDALTTEMIQARQRVMMVLRRITRESEKMRNRMLAIESSTTRGKAKRETNVTGVMGVWDAHAPAQKHQRSAITAVQAAEYLLSLQSPNPVPVKPNTLPAFAAHELLMQNPHLFLAEGNTKLWQGGKFMVRSRDEVEGIKQVQQIVSKATPQSAKQFDDFVERAKQVLQNKDSASARSIEWTQSDRQLLHAMTMSLYETRTTQTKIYNTLATIIVRAIDPYPGQMIDTGIVFQTLESLGVISSSDTATTSKHIEMASRSSAMAGVPVDHEAMPIDANGRRKPLNGFYKGDELDALRTDFSSQRVWVIDSESATELDDGISIERVEGSDDTWVHVHVADPTSMIGIDHPLAVRASFMGTALYLPDGDTPLFPMPEIMDRFSLGAIGSESGGVSNSDQGGQGVMTISTRLSPAGNMVDYKIQLGWIKSARLTTYKAVDEAMGRKGTSVARHPLGVPEALDAAVRLGASEAKDRVRAAKAVPVDRQERDELDALFTLATARCKHRLRNAGLFHTSPSGSITITSSNPSRPAPNLFASYRQMPSNFSLSDHTIGIDYTVDPSPVQNSINSADVVAEIMMLAAHVTAKWCSERGIPIPYRGGSAPVEVITSAGGASPGSMSVSELLGLRDERGVIDHLLVKRSGVVFGAGTVDVQPIDHWSIGLIGDDKGYSRVTSPLRRFDDLLVHAQIKTYLASRAANSAAVPSWGKMLDSNTVLELALRSAEGQRRHRFDAKTAHGLWLTRLVQSRLADPAAKGYRPDSTGNILDLNEPLKACVSMIDAQHSTPYLEVNLTDLPGLTTVTPPPGKFPNLQIGDELLVKVTAASSWPIPKMTAEIV